MITHPNAYSWVARNVLMRYACTYKNEYVYNLKTYSFYYVKKKDTMYTNKNISAPVPQREMLYINVSKDNDVPGDSSFIICSLDSNISILLKPAK